ncbi:NUC153 domain-containing protein [Encephalitozoon cuniculi]|nr:NUC153 domain-containing protein [Encephalitozoon cuniculi]
MREESLEEKANESSEKNGAVLGNPTKRLACVGMDWTRVDVKDLFKIFNSILPYSSPLSVKLCKTRIGRERLGDNNVFVKRCAGEGLRGCYVAVAEFEDVEDSKNVYSACDGVELGNSGMVLDLRFVPDSLDLRNVCDEAFGDDGYREKSFSRRTREKLEDEDTDSEMESKMQRLFEEKEIDFGLVSELVDMSDDGDAPDVASHLPASAESEEDDFLESSGDELDENLRESQENAKEKDRKESIGAIPRIKATDEFDGFVFDPKDKRFVAIFEDDNFSIDPTHPEYKKKGGMKEIMDEKRRRLKDNIE